MAKRINLYNNCLECNGLVKTTPRLISLGCGRYCSNLCKINYLWKDKDYAKKMSNAHKGKSNGALKKWRLNGGKSKGSLGCTPWNKGLPILPHVKNAIREANTGRVSWNNGNIGYLAGEKHYRWIPDRSKLAKHQERNDMAYKEWRKEIIRRDQSICRLQNENCIGYKIVHHILPWAQYPEERYNVNNGITLCQHHHPRRREDENKLIPMLQELVALKNY